jgi:glycosyltransferase involved in cell wall biosynthesis
VKILLAIHHFPPRHTGGVELVTLRAALWLLAHQHEVEIICVEAMDRSDGTEVSVQSDEYEGIPVHRLSFNLAAQGDPFQAAYRNPCIGRWFATHLRTVRPDILHIQSCYLLSASVIDAARQANVPTVVSLHDYWFICPRMTLLHPDRSRCAGPAPWDCTWCLKTERRRYRLLDRASRGLLGAAVRRLMHQPNGAARLGWHKSVNAITERQAYLTEQLKAVGVILTPSRFVRELMMQQGLDAGRVRWVAHGLDVSGWQRPVHAKRRNGQLRIGYLGNLVPHKGAHVLIEAFKHLRAGDQPVQLRLHGDPDKSPDYMLRLKRMADGDSRILLGGRYDNSAVAMLLSEMDVLVVPSLWYEIGPLVTLEAFASQTPVVAADLPNMKYQVAPEVDGLLYPADDPAALAHQLQRLRDDSSLLDRLRAGISPVRTSDEEMNEWLSLYQEVLTR